MTEPFDPGSVPNTASPTPDPASPQLDPPIEPDYWQLVQQQLSQLGKTIETVVQGIPTQTDLAFQQAMASAQLQLGGAPRDAKDRLSLALASYRITQDLPSLQAEVEAIANLLTPKQIEVVLAAISGAMERALLASCFYHVAPENLSPATLPRDPDGDVAVGDAAEPAVQSLKSWVELQQISARSYGLSGLPLVLDREGSVDIDTSAVLVTTLVAIEVAGATAGVVLQLLGSPELKKLLASDAKLRRQILKKGGKTLTQQQDPEHLARLLKDEEPESDDGYLWLTSLGIQGAQVAEFIGLQIRSIVRSDWLRLAIPIPLVLEALQLLTSDLVLSVGTAVESNLEATGAARRIELVLSALPLARRIPTPSQVAESAEAVLQKAETQLRPLLAQQLLKAADTFDPQLRNKNLNQLGQQLNLINPFQILQGWSSREWVIRLRETMEDLWQDYPTLAVLQTYVVGLEDSQDLGRTMEQAQALRQLSKALNPQDPSSEQGSQGDE